MANASPDYIEPEWIDQKSIQMSLRFDNILAGIVRYTPHFPSVVKGWSATASFIPESEGFVDITKGVVAPEFRRLGLYRLLMAATAVHASTLGFHQMQGIVSKMELLPVWIDMGCERLGREDHIFERHPIGPVPAQCISLNLVQNRLIAHEFEACIELGRERGYEAVLTVA